VRSADDCLVAAKQRTQAKHIRAAAVEDEERLATTECRAELRLRPGGPVVKAIRHRIASVGLDHGLKHGGMRAGVIVASEALTLCHATSVKESSAALPRSPRGC